MGTPNDGSNTLPPTPSIGVEGFPPTPSIGVGGSLSGKSGLGPINRHHACCIHREPIHAVFRY